MDLLQVLTFRNRYLPAFSSAPPQMPPICDVLKGQANHVMRCLGKGHTESVYHKALITAMNRAGVAHRSEVSCPIWFMGECVGFGRADMVIDDVIVEIKANKLPPKETSAQLKKYMESLALAEKKVFQGIVVNFNQKNGCVDIYRELGSQGRIEGSAIFERSTKKSSHIWDNAPKMFRRKASAVNERFKKARKA